MNVLALSCQKCGAALEAEEKTTFLTCLYCSARLKVVRTKSTAATELLESVADTTKTISSGVEKLQLQNELERIDREWMMDREKYLVRTNHSGGADTSFGYNIIGGGVLCVFGVILLISASKVGGLLAIGFGIFIVVSTMNKSNHYESAKREYEIKRRRVLHQLDGE